MKRIIALLLAVITVATLFCACGKKEADHKIEAILDYYVDRLGKNITEDDIKYIGEDGETRKTEYLIENEEEDIKETVFIQELGNLYRVFLEDEKMYSHVYSIPSDTTAEE